MNELLAQGLAVMFIGMGTVLAFLCTTIISMHIMSGIVQKLNVIFPEAAVQTSGAKSSSSAKDDESVAVAILAAILKK
ncbi:MAG: OadG family protein [Candidatus Gastranaerophilales bacterium]|nr:OadG family protein [Candidatus Gastranaerophilales bacterium]